MGGFGLPKWLLARLTFFDDPKLGWVIAVTMISTILIAALAGSLLPTLLRA